MTDTLMVVTSSQQNKVPVYQAESLQSIGHFLESSNAPRGCTTTGSAASSLGLDSIGDYFIALQKGQQKILIFEHGKQHPKFRCSMPEKMASCSLDRYGEYMFAGSQSGKVYCWKLSSGELISVHTLHYRPITYCTVTDDNYSLVTAGDDGLLCKSSLSLFLEPSSSSSQFQTQTHQDMIKQTLHTQPITSTCLNEEFIVSAGLDGKLICYDALSLQQLASNSSFSSNPIHALAILKGVLYCGLESGDVHLFTLPSLDPLPFTLANGHSAPVSVITSLPSSSSSMHSEEAYHADKSNHDATRIVTGSEDGTIRLWESPDFSQLSSSSSVIALPSLSLLTPFNPPSPISSILVGQGSRAVWRGAGGRGTQERAPVYISPLKQGLEDGSSKHGELSLLPSTSFVDVNSNDVLLKEEELEVYTPLFDEVHTISSKKKNKNKRQRSMEEEDDEHEADLKASRDMFSSRLPPPSMLKRQDTFGEHHPDALFQT